MMQNKEQSKKPITKKQKLIGLSIALLIPALAIILSVALVNEGINITDWVKRRSEGDSRGLLSLIRESLPNGEGTVMGEKNKVSKFSVFEKDLEPILSNPERIMINEINMDLNLVPVGLDEDGVMETPDNWQEAGWYIKGGKPGETKNLIINGHYDTNTGAPAAFFDLAELKYGDVVEVRDEYGRIFTYKVVILSYLDVEDPSRLEVLENEENKSTLTLITCGGDYLQGSGYDKRLVVKAESLD
jgi:LPXTG-site transpeptidase (sortase) family protein